MKIQYYTKNVYGADHRYIIDEKIKLAVMKLTGQTTLTPYAQEALQMLGFEFEEVLKPKEEN